MKRVNLDEAPAAVRTFIGNLPLDSDGVELEMEGEVVCEVLPPQAVTAAERAVLIARGRELAKRARERNKGVPAKVLEGEIEKAVAEVRRDQTT